MTLKEIEEDKYDEILTKITEYKERPYIYGSKDILEKLTRDNIRRENKIIDINIIVPDKVVEVTFGDYSKEKMVLKEPDVFNLEQALYIALAKKLYRKEYTYEGIEILVGSLKYKKKYVKIVSDGMKLYNQKLKDEAAAKEEAERIARKRAKRQAYKERRAKRLADEEAAMLQAEKEEMIEIQKEAYIRAMEYVKKEA